MISHHLKEDDADRLVKARLWDATQREILGFAEKYGAAHIVGVRASDEQEDIAEAAKGKGYPKTLVRQLGSVCRRISAAEQPDASIIERRSDLLRQYQIDIGLASSEPVNV